MKKIIFLLFFALLLAAPIAFAIEFRPSSVKAMDVDIRMEGKGILKGSVQPNDRMEIYALTFKDSETIKVIRVEEKLYIGNDVLNAARYQNDGENKYAVFVINNLSKYASTPEFSVDIVARLVSSAIFELGDDSQIGNVEADLKKYLDQTKYIEVNDQELRSKAQLEFTSNSSFETVRGVAEWVNNNIEYDFENYYNGVWSAKQTYNSRAGVCDEFANLTAAFTRIKGLPTRYISGISFDGKLFGNHGWTEVYLKNSGWVGVDSTYGEAGYVDAAHFPLSKSTDASEGASFKSVVYGMQPAEVEWLDLGTPEVTINDVSFFENLVDMKVEIPEKAVNGERFQVRAVVKNLQSGSIIIPVELLLHDGFAVDKPSRLELFKPFEQKEIVWDVTAPTKGKQGFFVSYETYVNTPDKNFFDKIDVYPEEESLGGSSEIKVVDVSPFIENDRMLLKILLKNSGDVEGSASIEALFEGSTVAETRVEVGAGQDKMVEMQITGIRPGELLLSVQADSSLQLKITIPEKIEEIEEPIEAAPEQITQEQFNNEKEGGAIGDFFQDTELLLTIMAGIAAVLFLAVLVISAVAVKKML